ncbi:hypothetical protein K4K59_004189 [Colletotrichum sp. SAR11_240]|nr:hypothetical protein K4K59_004189 [Colletotrichum sp. SAR11_240]
MARLAQIPKSQSALVATQDTREDSHGDKICSECEKLVDQIQDLTHEKHRIWYRFKDLEAKSVNQPTPTIDPTTLRSYIPDDVISVLLAASPEDEFTVTNFRYVAKARKAAAFWKVDLQHLLFQIAFDYGKQGEGCFAALCALAQADNNWPRCRTALQACVHDRRQLLLPQTSRRPTSLTSRKGVVESDVRAVISRVTPPPSSPERPPSQQQVVPEPSPTPAKGRQQVVQKPTHELTRVTESTPEKGRRHSDHQPRSSILTSSTRSLFQSTPSSPILPAAESLSRYKQLEAGDDSVVDVSDLNNLFNDDDLSNDFLVDDSVHPGASDFDNNNPIGSDSQDKTAEVFDEGTLYVNAGGTVPNTSAPSYQQAIPTQDKATEEQRNMSHTAKRPRLEDALSGSLADAQNIIKEDWWITDQQLMLTIGPMDSSSNLSSLVPRPTPNAPTADASVSSALPRPQQAKALSKQLKRIQAIQASDLKKCTTALCNVSLAIEVLDDVASSMTSNAEELEEKLKDAKVLEQVNGLNSKATTSQSKEMHYELPSAIRLTTLVERARGAKERTDAMLLLISKLRDDT